MSSENWEPIRASQRHTFRQMRRASRSIIRRLVEFITNSDDSYFRLEKEGKSIRGLIEIGYWKRPKERSKKYPVIKGFYVRDYAEGMDENLVAQAFGRESYGAPTSRSARRGCIGQGAKDALFGLEKCYVISVKNGALTAIQFMTDRTTGLNSRRLGQDASQKLLLDFDQKTAGHVDPISLAKNQTHAYFEIPKEMTSPRVETVIEAIQTFYMLRKILSDDSRKVELIDIDTGVSNTLRIKPTEGETIYRNTFSITYSGSSYQTQLEIKRAQRDLIQEGERREGGLLIVDEDNAVLDLTLMGFETNPAARRLFGETRIRGFKKIYEKDETVINDDRTGLDYNHEFNSLLRKQIVSTLDKIVAEEEKRRISQSPVINRVLDKRIRSALEKINSLIRREISDLYQTEDVGTYEGPPETLAFIPMETALFRGETREVRLLINGKLIEKRTVVNIDYYSEEIEVEPAGELTVDNPQRLEVVSIPLAITGKEVVTEAIITAKLGAFPPANLIVRVEAPEVLQPRNGFEFMPDWARVAKASKKKLRLVVDTTLVPPGKLVKVESTNSKIEIAGYNLFPVPLPLPDSAISQVFIRCKSDEVGEEGEIIASSEDREAFVHVKVVEPTERHGLFTDYVLDRDADERQRYSFTTRGERGGVIHVHTRAPVLKSYFGNNNELLNEDPRAQVLLCDTILSCISYEWAKIRVQEGIETVLGPEYEEIQRVARKIEHQFGTKIHEWIMGTIPEKTGSVVLKAAVAEE